jgi:poly(3-hydroxybutyrate) depolymerase
MTKYPQLTDTNAFIVTYPSPPHDNNFWDVASTKTLSHDGRWGGGSNGIANMLKYTLTKYNADPKRVFVTGTSSGAMMTNVMRAVYPNFIAAGSGYSGAAAGCLTGSPDSSPQQPLQPALTASTRRLHNGRLSFSHVSNVQRELSENAGMAWDGGQFCQLFEFDGGGEGVE